MDCFPDPQSSYIHSICFYSATVFDHTATEGIIKQLKG